MRLAQGGQVTNSPPAKVKTVDFEPITVLTSGIDTLSITIDAKWGGTSAFEYLDQLKLDATDDHPSPGMFHTNVDEEIWQFVVKPTGVSGYTFNLVSGVCNAHILARPEPHSRPNIKLTFRSQFMWERGLDGILTWVDKFLTAMGVVEMTIKPSRVDLCVDVLLPESEWHTGLKSYFTTRADNIGTFESNGKLTGFTIGKGDISARFYDKEEEIRRKSNKWWMFDIWGIDNVPENHRMIRFEFQLRRTKIKALGINFIDDLLNMEDQLWAYCTLKWLKLEINAGQHRSKKKLLPLWESVQRGYSGSIAHPLNLEKTNHVDREQCFLQIMGQLVRLYAIKHRGKDVSKISKASLLHEFQQLYNECHNHGYTDEQFTENVIRKISEM